METEVWRGTREAETAHVRGADGVSVREVREAFLLSPAQRERPRVGGIYYSCV